FSRSPTQLSLPPPTPTLFPYTTLFRSESRLSDVRIDDPLLRRETGRHAARRGPRLLLRRKSFRGPAHRSDETGGAQLAAESDRRDRKSTRLNSSHQIISYAVFCLKKKT